jgi:hypothetical protein
MLCLEMRRFQEPSEASRVGRGPVARYSTVENIWEIVLPSSPDFANLGRGYVIVVWSETSIVMRPMRTKICDRANTYLSF